MNREFLVGYTGFVGSNIAAEHSFTSLYNSKNIEQAYGEHPDLLVYSGVPAEMFLANQNPATDREIILQAERNIEKIAPKQVVLISTIAVYPQTQGVDEDTPINVDNLPAYGANRYALECWVKEHYAKNLIVRLPAVYGQNLKKNFIYDYIHFIPKLLKEDKFVELVAKEPILIEFYQRQENCFYRCKELNQNEKVLLKDCFKQLGFSALNFTDSRSKYQFYWLKYLWSHIEIALENDLRCLHMATPPIEIRQLYAELNGRDFVNEFNGKPFDYDIRTKHFEAFGGANGYIMSLEKEIQDIKQFVENDLTKG